MTVICRACPLSNCGAVTQFTIIVDEVNPENNKETKLKCAKCAFSFQTENCISITSNLITTTPAEDVVINILMHLEPKFGSHHPNLIADKVRHRLRAKNMSIDEAEPAMNNLARLGVIRITDYAIGLQL